MSAALRLNLVARGADGVLRATETVERNNERDRKHTVTLDEDRLKRLRDHAKDGTKSARPHEAPWTAIGTSRPASSVTGSQSGQKFAKLGEGGHQACGPQRDAGRHISV